MRFLLLLALAGCAPTIARVEIPEAEPIQPGSVRFTVTATGGILRDGVITSLADLPEVTKPGRLVTDPKLIEADPGVKLAAIGPILDALIVKGNCVNVAFLVTAGGEEREVPISIEVGHMCGCLKYYEGARIYDEHAGGEQKHLWIEVRPDPMAVSKMSDDPRNSIYFPDAEGDEPAKPPPPPPPAWATEPRPAAPLTVEAVRAFLTRDTIKAASPIIVLDLQAGDGLRDALSAIVTLRRAGARVLVEFRGF